MGTLGSWTSLQASLLCLYCVAETNMCLPHSQTHINTTVCVWSIFGIVYKVKKNLALDIISPQLCQAVTPLIIFTVPTLFEQEYFNSSMEIWIEHMNN